MTIDKHRRRKQAGNPRLVTTDYNNAAGDISSVLSFLVIGFPVSTEKTTCISHHFHLYRLFLFFSFFFCIDWRGASRPSKGGAWGHCTLLAPQARGVDKRGEKEGSYGGQGARVNSGHFSNTVLTMLRSFFPLSLFSFLFLFSFLSV